jgi:hypothetical protein
MATERDNGTLSRMLEMTPTKSAEACERETALLMAMVAARAPRLGRAARRASAPRRGPDGRLPALVSARSALAVLNARAPRYPRSAGGLAYRWRTERGLTEADSLELRADALAAWWQAKNGPESRFLVALVLANEPLSETLPELRPVDFQSVPYAGLFAA